MSVVSPSLASMPDGAMRGVFIHKNVLGLVRGFDDLGGDGRADRRDARPAADRVHLLAAGVICLASSGSMTAIIATSVAYCLIGFYSLLQRSSSIGRVVIVLFSFSCLSVS